MYRGMFATRPFDAGFGYLWGAGLGDHGWPLKPKEELPEETYWGRRAREELAKSGSS